MCADPRGAKKRSCISMAFCMVISALVFIFARPLMAIFVDAGETEVVLDGVRYLRIEGAFYCGLLSCAFIERVNKGRKPPKRDMVGRENSLEKAYFSEIGVVLKRYFYTSPTNAATFASKGFGGHTRHPIL